MPFVPSGRGRIKMSRQVQDKAGGQGDSWEDCGKAQGRGGLENIWAKGGEVWKAESRHGRTL